MKKRMPSTATAALPKFLSLVLVAVLSSFSSSVLQCDAQECATDGACDKHIRCPVWAEEGECFRSKQYMNQHCPVSCRSDVAVSSYLKHCTDAHERCSVWAELGECTVNTSMARYCPRSCGKCVGTDGNKEGSAAAANADASSSTATTTNDDKSCIDQHQQCEYWSSLGECEKNPTYMLDKCAKSCNSCDLKKTARKLSQDDDLLSRTAKFGDLQSAHGSKAAETRKVVEDFLDYMENSDDFKNLPDKIRKECKNRNELCAFWAAIGEVC